MIQIIRNNAFARNSLILFVGAMAANFLSYVFHLIIGRMVSVDVYGEVESLTSLVNIIAVPGMAITMAVTRLSAGFKASDNKSGSWSLWSYLNKKILIATLPIFLLILLITPWVRDFLNIKEIWPIVLIWILMWLSFFASVTGGLLNGWQKFKESSWIGVSSALIKLLAGAILVKAGFDLSGAIGGFVLGAIVSYLASVYVLRFIIKDRSKQISPKVNALGKVNFSSSVKYILPIFVGNLAINIFGNADMVLAKHNLDSQTAGQYGALFIVGKIIFFATSIIATVLFSMSAEGNYKKENTLKIFKQALYFILAICFLAGAAYFLFPKLILSLLFGGKYSGVAYYLGWFAVTAALFSLVNLIFQYLLSLHQNKTVYYLLAIAVLEGLTVLFLGSSIIAILMITIAGLLGAALLSLLFLLNLSRTAKNYEPADFYNSPNL